MEFDFIGKKRIWFTFSTIVILLGVAALIFRGLNFGIEFRGGTLFDLSLKRGASVKEIRDLLKTLKLEKSIIQPVPTAKNEVLIRTESLSKESQKNVLGLLDSAWGLRDVRAIQNVGPGWGAYITEAALLALGLSFVGLLIYISWRFEFKMAAAGVIAFVHDVLVAVGIYALVGREVTPNTVAALLTIFGYSLYDTIVVFHRVIENTPNLTRQQTYSSMVNSSLNQVLVRNLNTSLTTLLPVIALLSIGGETLKDFAFVLVIGLISGAYSTIFLACPLLAVWKEREPRYKALRKRLEKKG